MTLTDLVPTLDLCQQLKAAGFSQDTAFGWHKHIRVWGDGQFDDEWDWFLAEVCPRNADDFLCAAPTAGELEEWLMTRGKNASLVMSPDFMSYWQSARRKPHRVAVVTHVAALAALVLEVAG